MENHGDYCGSRTVSERHSQPLEVLLIDLFDECLTIKATSSPYFALSYVWGSQIVVRTTRSNLEERKRAGSLTDLSDMPQTVLDAMALTKVMGIRYLWVDCLCIIQDSPEIQRYIANMDIIFSQAEVTIIAVSSNDANSGLAGVLPGSRVERSITRSQGNHCLTLDIPIHKYDLLRDTVYSSRGWTFQELVLSKRFLFVTDQQLVFHCGRSYRSESHPTERPLTVLSNSFGRGVIDFHSSGDGVSHNAMAMRLYQTIIPDYSQRHLTYPNDIENAFAGLASIFQEWMEGSPVLNGVLSRFFGYCILWEFDETPFSFSDLEKESRRTGFPSWSWVGWVSGVHIVQHLHCLELPLQSMIENISILDVQSLNEAPKDLEIIDASVQDGSSTGKRQHIHITRNSSHLHGHSVHSVRVNMLSFNAERATWDHFTFRGSLKESNLMTFSRTGSSFVCGYLSVAPSQEIVDSILNSTTSATDDWSLVQLYQLQLVDPKPSFFNRLRHKLQALEEYGAAEPGFDEEFYAKLLQSDVIFFILVRRRGVYWERVGSGLMLQQSWPSTSGDTQSQVCKERIGLL
jgi:heterokaryon incompatibility protein (HET)